MINPIACKPPGRNCPPEKDSGRSNLLKHIVMSIQRSILKKGVLLLVVILPAILRGQTPKPAVSPHLQGGEIIYHVFQRSFYDSNGDGIGDLNGLREKLGYLQELGVTSILMVPLYESDFYHNYFAKDFEKIDPAFGTMQDYIRLVREVHRRGMKIYMDMETQYVAGDHPWFRDSYGNLFSPYRDYIYWDDSAHREPEPLYKGYLKLNSYNGTSHTVATVNLNSQKVLDYNIRLFSFFADPNHDGKFDDGVDGFRLDHMMDDLDNKGILTDLFRRFWSPLITRLKQLNPRLIFIAEQANWGSYGFEYFKKAGIDRVFDFRLRFAIASFDKKAIETMADTTLDMTPAGKQQIVFIENHDLPRFASIVGLSLPKEEIGGAFNLFLGGVPSIYYGQELGMYGGLEKFGITDGNDIPKREAFEWYKADTGKGMALWYKNTGPWWDSSHLVPNDGISLEEEKNDPGSLWDFYRKIIQLRQSQPPLWKGKYLTLENDNDSVCSFIRVLGNQGDMVVINLASSPELVKVYCPNGVLRYSHLQPLYGDLRPIPSDGNFSILLPPYAINLWKAD